MDDDAVWGAFDGRSGPLRMGLRPLDPATWTDPPPRPELAAELDRKAALLAGRPGDTLSAEPGSEAAAAELLGLLVEHLVTDHPSRYSRVGGEIVLIDDARRWPVGADVEALDTAGRLVAEDWCLVRPGTPPTLAAGTLCSPNRWALAEKLGLPISSVHGPVPGYGDELGRPVDRLLSTGAAGRAVWRRNWSIVDSPDLFQPTPLHAGPVTSVPAGLWVRSERQTLVRLPVTGWWVFGIRTYQRPLADLDGRPGIAGAVRAAILTLGPAQAAYKEISPFRDALIDWLDHQLV